MADRFAALTPYFPALGEPKTSYATDGLEPLAYTVDPNGDGKAVYNPPRPDGKKSPFYDALYDREGAPGSQSWWDFHVYHKATNPGHVAYAHKLYEAVRREFPECRAYRFFEGPLGPHPMPMFEVNVFNPEQLGALFSWFVANRGPCSVLIHPNTGDDVTDHTTNGTWIGEKVPLDVDLLQAFESMQKAKRESNV